MSDLHARLVAAVEHRLDLARAAQNAGRGEWSQFDPDREPGLIQDERGEIVTYDEGRPTEGQAAFIAANDPATILRHAEADLRRLERHGPWRSDPASNRPDPATRCARCDYIRHPCDELADLMDAYAVELPEGDET